MRSRWYLNFILVTTWIDQMFNVKNSLFLILKAKAHLSGKYYKLSLMCFLYYVNIPFVILKSIHF